MATFENNSKQLSNPTAKLTPSITRVVSTEGLKEFLRYKKEDETKMIIKNRYKHQKLKIE
jgi:hypothetical protein